MSVVDIWNTYKLILPTWLISRTSTQWSKKKNGLTPGASYLALWIIASQFRIWLFCGEIFYTPSTWPCLCHPLSPLVCTATRARSLWLYRPASRFAYSIYSVGVFVFPVTSTSARCMREHVQAPTCVCALRVCVLVYSYAYTFSFLLLSCVRVGARTWTWRTANGWEQRVDSMPRQAWNVRFKFKTFVVSIARSKRMRPWICHIVWPESMRICKPAFFFWRLNNLVYIRCICFVYVRFFASKVESEIVQWNHFFFVSGRFSWKESSNDIILCLKVTRQNE